MNAAEYSRSSRSNDKVNEVLFLAIQIHKNLASNVNLIKCLGC